MTPEQTKRFKYWQTRTIVATMIGYALFYFVRKNFSLAMPGLEADLGISKTSLGIFLTLNGVVYGLSRFVNGILADRMNARWYMAVGLALCALANFAFGFGEDVSYWITGQHDGSQFTNTMILFMGIMWVINGLLQGTGFPPCARLLTHWIPPTQLATKMSVWNTSHSIGAGLVVILCGYIMGTLGMNVSADPDAVQPGDAAGMERVMAAAAHAGAWKWCFWIPSAISFAGAIGLVVFLRDTPSSVGLPELEGTEVRKEKKAAKGAEHRAFLMKHEPADLDSGLCQFLCLCRPLFGPRLGAFAAEPVEGRQHGACRLAGGDVRDRGHRRHAGRRLGDGQVAERPCPPHLRILHGGSRGFRLSLLAAAR